MRECIRCGATMKENCGIKERGNMGYFIVLTDNKQKVIGGSLGAPAVAICPKCGEVSIYIDDLSALKSLEE